MRIDELESIMEGVKEDTMGGREEAVWTRVESLLRAQQHHERVALALVAIVERGYLPNDNALTVLTEVYSAHSRSESILAALGEALEQARDVDLLNDAPRRIAAPGEFDLRELLHQIDAAVAKRERCRIYAPDLCEAAGFPDRAAFESRRFQMIGNS